MLEFLNFKDRDAVTAIYDASVKVMTRDGTAEEKVLQAFVEKLQRAAVVIKYFRSDDFFESSFLRMASVQL